jgi:hypothetical protein
MEHPKEPPDSPSGTSEQPESRQPVNHEGDRPAEAPHKEAQPAEAPHREARPGEARDREARPGEARDREARPGEARDREARPGEARDREARPGEARDSWTDEVLPKAMRQRLESFIPDLVKRTFAAGMGAVFSTEEGIRRVTKDMSLPKDVAGYLASTAGNTKDEIIRIIAREVREFLQTVNVSDEIAKMLTMLSFEIKTEIRFIPNEEQYGSIKPDVKAEVRLKHNEGSADRSEDRNEDRSEDRSRRRRRRRRRRSEADEPQGDSSE